MTFEEFSINFNEQSYTYINHTKKRYLQSVVASVERKPVTRDEMLTFAYAYLKDARMLTEQYYSTFEYQGDIDKC